MVFFSNNLKAFNSIDKLQSNLKPNETKKKKLNNITSLYN